MAETDTPEAPKAPDESTITANEAWRRTWEERVAEVEAGLGKSHPPGAEPGDMLELPPELRHGHMIPGGRLLILPPDAARKRPHWLFSTLGLSQPLGGEKVDPTKDPPPPSRLGLEFGIAVADLAPWPFIALCHLAKLALEPPAPIKIGTRVPFLFAKPKAGSGAEGAEGGEELVPCVGAIPQNHEIAGDVSSLLLWPPLDRDGPFVTSTGRFDLLVGTTITGDEWDMAKGTSSAHLLYLLVLAGVGQRSDPWRKTVTTDERWAKEWERVSKLSREAVLDALYGPA